MLYREDLTAGVPKRIALAGNFFRVKRLSGVTSESIGVLFFRDNKLLEHDLTSADAGDGIGPLPAGQGFDELLITSTETQQIQFDVSRGLRFSQRVVGEVSVIDGGEARTRAGIAFLGNGSRVAVAAQFSHLQLWNPTADRDLIVWDFQFSTGAASQCSLRRHNVALTALNNPPNKLLGGAASAGEIRQTTNVAVLGTTIANYEILALQTFLAGLREPICVSPGEGLVVACELLNTTLRVAFQFYERMR